MNIGERIKNLRLSKLMTQRELAGTEITRNMLSQIENGIASPSLKTLNYLSSRLGVPVGYLIADEGTNETFYKKYSNYSNLIESYKSGEWAICRDICKECSSGYMDNELSYMQAMSSLNLGISYFNEGKLRDALEMFEEAVECASYSVFDMSAEFSKLSAYSEIMSMISPTLSIEIPHNDMNETLCRSEINMFADEILMRCHYSENDWNNKEYYYALSARGLIEKGNYEASVALLSHVFENNMLPSPIMYLVMADYEECCKEIGDYKTAYELSGAKLQLFEKMLSQK